MILNVINITFLLKVPQTLSWGTSRIRSHALMVENKCLFILSVYLKQYAPSVCNALFGLLFKVPPPK